MIKLMNKKGQAKKMQGLTLFLMVFLLGILGAVFAEQIGDTTTGVTTVLTRVNDTITAPAVNSTVNLNFLSLTHTHTV